MFNRILKNKLPKESFFLFGPRQTGKSTLLNQLSRVFSVDLLDPEKQLAYTQHPNLLAQQIEAGPHEGLVFIDEIQRVPKLLDVIHHLVEKYPALYFAMSGSSARKLRHGAANLLGGRALYRSLYPLTSQEIGQDFQLNQAMRYGTLPKVYSRLLNKEEERAQDLLRAYVITYVREEIKAEALVRNLQGFQNFLDVAAANFAQQINYTEVARQCAVAYATVREYYAILEDTLMGFFLRPWLKSERKRMSHSPKFYFFDNGVTRAILQALKSPPTPLEAGYLFEQWFMDEIHALNMYEQKDWKFSFWRTSHGAEVDIIIEQGREVKMALECKFKKNLSPADLSGIHAFQQEYPDVPCYVVADIEVPLQMRNIKALPVQQALEMLRQS